jgi:hypothetical protein
MLRDLGSCSRFASRSLLLRLPALGDNAAMQTDRPKAEPPKRKRRWFQFSLRSLMVFTVVCAIGAAWLGRKIEQKRKERELAEALVKRGGDVRYDYEETNGQRRGPEWLRGLLGEDLFSEVETVMFFGRRPTDDQLEKLKIFTHLKVLWLHWRVTDADLTHLSRLTQLQSLSLYLPEVRDAGMKNLKALVRLQTLNLYGAENITDAGLKNLKDLTQLRSLTLDDDYRNETIEAGLEDLKKALPNCEIRHTESLKDYSGEVMRVQESPAPAADSER